ncbi:sensor histidine kinase [Clostridium sp.]
MKLKRKYFLIIFSTFIVISLGITFTAYYLSNYILIKKYVEISTENLNYIVERTNKELTQLKKTFEYISNNNLVLNRVTSDYEIEGEFAKVQDDRNVNNILATLATFDIFDSVEAVYISGNNGENFLYGYGNDSDEKKIIKNRVENSKLVGRKLLYLGIENSYYKSLKNTKVLKFAQKLYDVYGKEVGWLYFELNADYFKQIFSYDEVKSNTEIYLVDSDNNVIYSDSKNSVKGILQEDSFNTVFVKKHLSSYDWSLISVTPENRIIDESKLIIEVTLFTAIISIIIEFFLITLITRRMVKPIIELTEAMSKIRNGNLDIQVDCSRNDEIGELTDNFNAMTKDLKGNLDREIGNQRLIKDAEYKALQAQINPHFMYNCLNVLKWLAGVQGADNIIEAINALWELLRTTSSMDGQFVELRTELEIISAYSKLQQLRYNGKFELIYKIEDDLSIVIPKYILQPFVENSIFHGIGPKKGMGTIIVSTKKLDKNLFITVEDNGVGMGKDIANRLLVENTSKNEGKGLNNIGVRNVHERLKLIYGDSYGIGVSSEIYKGTVITIRIPLDDENQRRR